MKAKAVQEVEGNAVLKWIEGCPTARVSIGPVSKTKTLRSETYNKLAEVMEELTADDPEITDGKVRRHAEAFPPKPAPEPVAEDTKGDDPEQKPE